MKFHYVMGSNPFNFKFFTDFDEVVPFVKGHGRCTRIAPDQPPAVLAHMLNAGVQAGRTMPTTPEFRQGGHPPKPPCIPT